MLCIMALEQHGVTPESGEILVTGATGGVGSVAVAILAKLGYQVVAMTGRPEGSEYVTTLGAAEVMLRSEYAEPGRLWAESAGRVLWMLSVAMCLPMPAPPPNIEAW